MISFYIIVCIFVLIFVSSSALNNSNQNPKGQNKIIAAGRYNNTNRRNAPGAYNYQNRQNTKNAGGQYNYPNRQNAKNAVGQYNYLNRLNANNAAGQYNNPNRQNANNFAGQYNYPNRQNAINAVGQYNYPNRQNANNAGGQYNNPNRQNANNAKRPYNYNNPNRQNANIAAGVKLQNTDDGIPKKEDLEKYVLALDNLLSFYYKAPNDVDVNIVFGFFLSKVNLMSALKNKQASNGNITGLPVTLSAKLKNITRMNEIILRYFKMMSAQSQNPMRYHRQLKKIATLFSNETQWISLMKTADNKEVVDTPGLSYNDIVYRFSSWPEYKKQIDNMQRIIPSFDQTEKCLITLAENKVNYGNSTFQNCILPDQCHTVVMAGHELGFGMTNRLMILIQARFARRCSLFNEEEDEKLLQYLCSSGFYEASFISMNKYTPLILILEQITLCSLNGHVEFLRRPWLAYILALQTQYGCFSDHVMTSSQRRSMRPIRPSPQWRIDRGNKPPSGQTCIGPISAAAAAILSAGVKYIMDLYY